MDKETPAMIYNIIAGVPDGSFRAGYVYGINWPFPK